MRAKKTGFAAEAKAKVDSKYDPVLASELLVWIKEVTGDTTINSEDGSMDNMYEVLKDGTVLCSLINALQEGSIKKVNKSTMAFKCMENIEQFLQSASKLGVADYELFQTVDLWEKQNMFSVQTCLQSLARKATKFGKPSLGPKESESQLKAIH